MVNFRFKSPPLATAFPLQLNDLIVLSLETENNDSFEFDFNFVSQFTCVQTPVCNLSFRERF